MRRTSLPVAAACVLLVRDSQSGLQVLMIRRGQTMQFAPGKIVFPGGKLDASDVRRTKWRPLIKENILPGDYGFRIAALRELWEETGIHLQNHCLTRYSHRGIAFDSALKKRRQSITLSALVPFAHWVTPEGLPLRYDTRFYIAPYKGRMEGTADGSETVGLEWINPGLFLKEHQNSTHKLMLPTRMNLQKLARAATINEALLQARLTPVIRTEPLLKDLPSSGVYTIQ